MPSTFSTVSSDSGLWCLEQQFANDFTPERQAWISLYDVVQTEMLRAAQQIL
jgi:hypothetical protein